MQLILANWIITKKLVRAFLSGCTVCYILHIELYTFKFIPTNTVKSTIIDNTENIYIWMINGNYDDNSSNKIL